MEFGETENGYFYIDLKRHAKLFTPNEVTYAIKKNLIEQGIYIGEGNSEFKRNSFRLINCCNKYENSELVRELVRNSSRT